MYSGGRFVLCSLRLCVSFLCQSNSFSPSASMSICRSLSLSLWCHVRACGEQFLQVLSIAALQANVDVYRSILRVRTRNVFDDPQFLFGRGVYGRVKRNIIVTVAARGEADQLREPSPGCEVTRSEQLYPIRAGREVSKQDRVPHEIAIAEKDRPRANETVPISLLHKIR